MASRKFEKRKTRERKKSQNRSCKVKQDIAPPPMRSGLYNNLALAALLATAITVPPEHE